jgi:hypothetical protein
MSNADDATPTELSIAYDDGRRAGLALGALALAVVAFVNLLSIEKSILAAVLAIIAMRGSRGGAAISRGRLALGIAALHLAIATIAFALLRDQLAQLFHLLQTLG